MRDDETDVGPAMQLLRCVLDDRVTLMQPPHLVAEVGAVLAREVPETVQASLHDLLAIDMQIIESEAVYARAMTLAARYGHHLFDTLYHAVALETDGALLVTADDRYLRKARGEGCIVRLAELPLLTQ